MKRKWLGLALAAAMACAGAATQSTADVLAEDSAANYTAETFVNGANEGTGFGAWEFWNAAPVLADSTAGVCGDINSENGVSFRFAQDGVEDHWGYCNGYRGFDALNPGDVLTFKFTCAYCGGNRGLDLFANGGHSDDDKIANVINLSGDNEYSVNGVVIANNWAPHAVSEVTVSQLADGIEIAIKRTSTEEGVEDLEYSTKVETSAKLTGIGLYAGGWDWNDGADVENYAFYVNDLKIEGIPPADKLTLSGENDPWKVVSAASEVTFTVSRTGSEGDLEVALSSSYPEFVSVPESVTIEDGATSADFTAQVALQGAWNEATLSASAPGVSGDSYGIRGPKYSMSVAAEQVDAETEYSFWVDCDDLAVRDDSKLTLVSDPVGALDATAPADWTWQDKENGAFVEAKFTAHESGKLILKFDGVEFASKDISIIQAGATLSGPTSIRVGVPATYTLDVTLPSGMTDSLGLEAEGDLEVVIDPADAQELEASGQLEFTVTAMAAGTFTLLPFDTEGLSFNELKITVTEAPVYDDYVAYDDASLYDGSFDFASTGVGTEGFGAWYVHPEKHSAEYGGVLVTEADGGFPAILSDGAAFALYANGSDPDYALVRPFVNDLQPGQAASIEFVAPQEGGSRYIQFARIWEGTPYNRFEIWANGGAVGINVDGGDSRDLGWSANSRRIVASVQRAADGSSYTLSLTGYNEGSEFADDVFQYSINSDVGSWGDGLQGIVIGGYDLPSDLIFNTLAIEQVEEPVKPGATMEWTAGVWNPDEVGVAYTFGLKSSEEGAIGLVDLSVEPAEGIELSADQLDLSEGEATFTVTLTGDELPAGTSFTITAKAQAEGVGDATYGLTATAPYSEIQTTSGAYTFDYVSGGTVEFQIVGTPSRAGQTVSLDSDNEAILAPPSPAEVVVGAIGSQDGKFTYTMVGAEEGEVWIHATKDEAEWGYAGITINGTSSDEPVIDDETVVEISFAGGLSGKVSEEMASQYTGVKAQVLQWNGENKAFEEVEVLANEATWPEMKFTPSIDNPVIRLIFAK